MTFWTCDKRVDKSGNVDYRLIATCHELFGPSTPLGICFYWFAFLRNTGFYVLCTVDWIFRKNLPDIVLLIFHNEICFTTFLNKFGGLNTIIADGNGAAFIEPPNFNLPLINLISPLTQ